MNGGRVPLRSIRTGMLEGLFLSSNATVRVVFEGVEMLSGGRAAGWCGPEWFPAHCKRWWPLHQPLSPLELRCSRLHSAQTHGGNSRKLWEQSLQVAWRRSHFIVGAYHRQKGRGLFSLHCTALHSPVWPGLCCPWRGRRRRSWQPRPSGSWSSSSSQPVTEAQAPHQTWPSRPPGQDPNE